MKAEPENPPEAKGKSNLKIKMKSHDAQVNIEATGKSEPERIQELPLIPLSFIDCNQIINLLDKIIFQCE